MGAPSADDERIARRALLRRATLQLLGGIVTLHVVAIAIFYLSGIAAGPERPRTIFVAVWTAATAITVAVLLRRVRQARFLTRR